MWQYYERAVSKQGGTASALTQATQRPPLAAVPPIRPWKQPGSADNISRHGTGSGRWVHSAAGISAPLLLLTSVNVVHLLTMSFWSCQQQTLITSKTHFFGRERLLLWCCRRILCCTAILSFHRQQLPTSSPYWRLGMCITWIIFLVQKIKNIWQIYTIQSVYWICNYNHLKKGCHH